MLRQVADIIVKLVNLLKRPEAPIEEVLTVEEDEDDKIVEV